MIRLFYHPAEQDLALNTGSLSVTERRVLDHLWTQLDFCEPRKVKSQGHAEQSGTDRMDFINALDRFVEIGYLIEHQRAERGIRRFTLAHSLNPERRLRDLLASANTSTATD